MKTNEFEALRIILNRAGRSDLIRKVAALQRSNNHLKVTIQDILPDIDWWEDAKEWLDKNEGKDSTKLVCYIIAGLVSQYRRLLQKFDLAYDAIVGAHKLLETETETENANSKHNGPAV